MWKFREQESGAGWSPEPTEPSTGHIHKPGLRPSTCAACSRIMAGAEAELSLYCVKCLSIVKYTDRPPSYLNMSEEYERPQVGVGASDLGEPETLP